MSYAVAFRNASPLAESQKNDEEPEIGTLTEGFLGSLLVIFSWVWKEPKLVGAKVICTCKLAPAPSVNEP